jgi:hypothetical protein
MSLDFITPILFGDVYNMWRSALRNFLLPPNTFLLLRPIFSSASCSQMTSAFEHQFYMCWLANFHETRQIVNTVLLIKGYSLRSNSVMNSTNGVKLWGLNSVSTSVVSWGGVGLSPLGTSATIWPTVPAPDDRWWVWSSRWNEDWQGKPKYSEKTCSSATLLTKNPTWPDLGSNPGRRGGKPATNRLSCGTALALL